MFQLVHDPQQSSVLVRRLDTGERGGPESIHDIHVGFPTACVHLEQLLIQIVSDP